MQPSTRSEPARGSTAARSRLPLLAAGLAAVAVLGAAVHLSQGTADVGALDVLKLLSGGGGGGGGGGAVVVESRLPRLLTAIVVGGALAVAGAVLQSVSRNIMASPDTLAVASGAHLAIVAVAAFGISVPLLGSAGIAFAGGLGAAALVLLLSGMGGTGIVRLVLAGTAIALAMSSATSILLLLFSEETQGLFAWGAGSLGQNGIDGVRALGPVAAGALALLLLLARRLDLVHLGEDHARSLGVRVGAVRLLAIPLAVLLAACAVTLAGPIGFVGLAAPVLVRLLTDVVPGLHRHAVLLPISALTGAVLLIGADVLVRALIGSEAALEVPTGVVTSLLGAVFLVVLARRSSTGSAEPPAPGGRDGVAVVRYRMLLGGLVVVLAVALVGALLLGDSGLLLGDLSNWISGRAGPIVTNVMASRLPRVCAALLGGATLALAGALIQAVTRNPLAEPGIAGVVGGAGLGAVGALTLVPAIGFWAQTGFAGLGAALATALVFALAARGGFAGERLVLIGFGVQAATQALVTLLIAASDPWNQTKALTWLGGSTYGRTTDQLLPMALALLVIVPVLVRYQRELDLLSVDDETPRVLGVDVPRVRLVLLIAAVVPTAAAVAGVGTIGFVGLVAPHAARAMVGRRHSRMLPVAALLGALLVCAADALGRTVIAPAQLPAGLVTACLGAPYFVRLLLRSKPEGT